MRTMTPTDSNQNTSRREFIATLSAALAVATWPKGRVYAQEDEFVALDAVDLSELVRTKAIKPEELLDVIIARIEGLNPRLNAIVTPMYDEARRTIHAGLPDGPLAGVPFLLKDLFAPYKGVRNTAGSRLLANAIADHDNTLVARYKKAGLVIAGRTNAPEFGLVPTTEPLLFGPAKNPWNLERSPGGSSGGSAAAVAARIVPVAHGNDGGGSIRIPSSCCGLFGLKPSRGRVPTGPDSGELVEGLGTDHVLSISVRDSAAVLDGSAGPEPGEPYGIPTPKRPFFEEVNREPKRLRIALATSSVSHDVHPDCSTAVDQTAKLCEDLGHTVEETFPQLDWEPLRDAILLVFCAHMAATFDQIGAVYGKKVTSDLVEPYSWAASERGRRASAADFANTKMHFNAAARAFGEFHQKYDLILTPTLAAPPPKLGHFDTVNLPFDEVVSRIFNFMPFTWIFNVTGRPAMSVPLHWNDDDLPIGVQFAADYAREDILFQLAGQLERANPWRNKMPPGLTLRETTRR